MMSHFLVCSTKLYSSRTRIPTSLSLSISRSFLFRNGDSTNLYLLPTPCHNFSTTYLEHLTAANKSFTLSYLMNSCGLSEDQSISASKEIQLKTSSQPDSVLALFRSHEFSDTQISKIIQKLPALLLFKPDKNLKPKLEYFNSIGFSGPKLAHLLCINPQILNHSLEKRIKPVIAFLKGLGITQTNVNKLITRANWILGHSPERRLVPNIFLLQTHGVPDYYISKLLVLNANTMLCTNRLHEVVKDINKLGFDPSKASFIEAVHVLSGLNKSAWEAKCNIFKRWGWSEDDIQTAFRIKPNFMMFSEEKVTGVMEFLVNKVGYDPLLVAKDPFVLTYSTEKRIIPRFSVIHVLIANGFIDKDFNISGVLRQRDNDFLKRFVTKFQEQVPSLLNVYQGKK